MPDEKKKKGFSSLTTAVKNWVLSLFSQKIVTELLSPFARRIISFINWSKFFFFNSTFCVIFSNIFPLNPVYSYLKKFKLIQMCDIPLKSTELSVSVWHGFFFPSLRLSYMVTSVWFEITKFRIGQILQDAEYPKLISASKEVFITP